MIKKLINKKPFPALLLILIIGLVMVLVCHHDACSAQRSRQSDRHSRKKSSNAGKSSRSGRTRSASAQNRSVQNDNLSKSSPALNNNFSQGVREFHRGSYSPARRYLEAARSENPELMDYVLYYLARSLEELGDRQQAIATFEKLLAQYPQSRFTPKATLKVADICFFLRQYEKARVYYQKGMDLVPDKKEYILFQTALSLIDEKKWTETRDILKKILVQFPGGEYARLSIMCNQELEKEYHLPPLTFSEEDRMEMIQAQIRGRCYEEALRQIVELRKQPSISPGCRAHLLFQEASCHTKLGNKDQALEVLRRLVRLYPGSDDAAESLLRIGNTLWNQDRDAEAVDTYENVVKNFARRAGAADKAWYMIGRIHEQNRNYPKAIASFQSLVRNFPKSSYYPESLWRIGWGSYQQGKYQEARQRFKDALTKVEEPLDKHQLLYWQARAAEKSHDSPAALSLYQTIADDGYYSYYTWWAQQRVEKWSAPALLDSFPGQIEITKVSYSEDVRFHLVRARKLLEYGLKEEAAGEIRILVEARESDPGYWYNLSKLARSAGMNREAVLAGSRCQQSLARQGRSESYADVLEMLYPLIYWESIERHAGRYGLDPLIVCALMRQESMFDPLSLSSARAYGLMQIIPSTARMIASRINAFGGQSFDVERLYDPDVNIAFGCWYLADLLQRFDGNLVYTLISYNAGEETLKRWRNQYNTVNLDEFVEMLSYKETRNYVKKVLKNYGYYTRLYSSKPATSPASPAPKQVNRQDSQARRGTSGTTGLNHGGKG